MFTIETYLDWIFISVSLAINVFYVYLMLRYFLGWSKLKLRSSKDVFSTKVSIVIACRNEEDNIKKNLESLIHQNYPNHLYEVIIVDDQSEDDTARIVEDFSKNFENVHLHKVYKGEGKRNALTEGISIAKGDFIMTTDGDCWVSSNWVSSVVSEYEASGAKMILGPVQFKKGRTPLVWFQELDFMGMIGIAGASAANAYPHVCNGANLSYEKQAFYEIKGFEGEDKNPSGDDMILLQKMNARYRGEIKFVKKVEAMTYTYPMYNWSDFFNQRIRWASKSSEMLDRKISLILGSVLLYNLWPIVLLIAGIWNANLMHLIWLHLSIKFIFDYLFLSKVLSFFKRKKLLLFYPVAQLIHLFYIVIVGIYSQLSSFEWKGRKIQA